MAANNLDASIARAQLVFASSDPSRPGEGWFGELFFLTQHSRLELAALPATVDEFRRVSGFRNAILISITIDLFPFERMRSTGASSLLIADHTGLMSSSRQPCPWQHRWRERDDLKKKLSPCDLKEGLEL
jgi:hypothetical protein